MDAFERLSKAYGEYKGAYAHSSDSVNGKCQINSLTEQLRKEGVCGSNALQLLTTYKQQIGWQNMHPEDFRHFYQFAFFICRDSGKRNVKVPIALALWRELLQGRFRLLDRWCIFMADHFKALVVTEDLWTQVLEFSRTVHEDLSNYDPTAAWPVALDEFVEHLRRAARKPAEPMDLYNPGSAEPLLSAVSPRSGSKRRVMQLGVAEVAEQLQQLPLACADSQLHGQVQQSAAAVSDKQRAGHHMVKRYRVAGPAAYAAPVPMRPGFRSPQAATGQRPCESCNGGVQLGSPGASHRSTGGLQPMAKSLAASSGRHGCGVPCSPGHHRQQHGLNTSMGPMCPAVGLEPAWGKQRACINNLGAAPMQRGGPLHGRGSQPEAHCCSCGSMNALMQATVTDTLFYA